MGRGVQGQSAVPGLAHKPPEATGKDTDSVFPLRTDSTALWKGLWMGLWFVGFLEMFLFAFLDEFGEQPGLGTCSTDI